MSATAFLINCDLWEALVQRVKSARRVDAAIAYFGRGGAELLPLQCGHRLVVDLSTPTVTTGATDPREVEKLIRRGVRVYTRSGLHAKLIVADNAVIAGSANVSRHSVRSLDEAGILTSDWSAVRRAREFVNRISTEPVRPDYLSHCKRIYRPPQFNGRPAIPTKHHPRAAHSKLWLVRLGEYSVPESEQERYAQGSTTAEKLIRNATGCTTDSFHWPSKPRMADELEVGDWIIEVLRHRDGKTTVHPPAQLLLVDHYFRNRDLRKERWVFHLEVPKRGQMMSWAAFRSAAPTSVRRERLQKPRTQPIREVQAADALLALWTPSGRIAR